MEKKHDTPPVLEQVVILRFINLLMDFHYYLQVKFAVM